MSWWPFGGKKKGQAEQDQEEPETPRRKQRGQQSSQQQQKPSRQAPAAKKIPDNIVYADALETLRKQGYTDETEMIKRLKLYGGDVNSVLLELDLDRKGTSSEASPQRQEPATEQVQTVSANDVDEKSMIDAASAFKEGDAVVSQLGFGRVIEVREDGIVVVSLKGETTGYFAPDALTVTNDFVDFATDDIVQSPMGRSKVLRVRGADGMVVLQTPTGSEGYFHPSSLEKLDSKFFLADQLPKIRSWTAATVREAVSEIYPEVGERLYAKSITGAKLIGLSEEEVLHLTNMGANFDAERWDRVAATLGLVCMKDVETFEQGMAKTGAVGPLAGDLAPRGFQSLGGDPELVKFGQRQSDQIGRLEDMMVEIDRLTLTPQAFDLRQRQAKVVKKLSGLLSSLPNGIQLVREAQIEARKSSFVAAEDEKALEVGDADPALINLARRQDVVYQRLVDAGKQLQDIAQQRGVKLPPFNPKPLPTFDMSMASMEKLIVRERPQQATEEKTSSSAQLYNPQGLHGGKRGGDPLGKAVEAESKELDLDTLTIVFRVNKEKEDQTVQMPLSHNQKSVTVGGVRKAIQEFLGDRRIDAIKKGSKKNAKTFQDTDELNVGRKRRVEVKVFTAE